MPYTHVLGYPRIGARRELKFALESHWRGETDAAQLEAVAARLRLAHWQRQRDAGLALLAAGDFSFYDHVLDHALMFAALPKRFRDADLGSGLALAFALARGTPTEPALEMTKWFDTNYHYLVPELDRQTSFELDADRYLEQVRAARAVHPGVKPVLLGPVTFLWLSKTVDGSDRLALLPALLPLYRQLLVELAALDVTWVQMDEPVLGLELDAPWRQALRQAYAALQAGARPRLLAATYFTGIDHQLDLVRELAVDGWHIDAVRAPQQAQAVAQALAGEQVLSIGIVDGRNVWRTDLTAALARLRPLYERLGERLWLAPSCSLIHVPHGLAQESRLDREVRQWLAFADEKLDEVVMLARALEYGEAAVREALAESDAAQASRRHSQRVSDANVDERLNEISTPMTERTRPYAERQRLQHEALRLPTLPTTTIGSFPQTAEIRRARATYKQGQLSDQDYLQAMRAEVRRAIEEQERLGLDVLVHGEPERNDMVEYFAQHLAGFAISEHGWVQSYGSRCVKPPILYGDVYRPAPITVDFARFAQQLTSKPVKGMLTGPVTMLQWSFVRDDQPRDRTALQLALAIRDEVQDLEAAGIRIIQIDEPAFREGLPLKASAWPAYLDWAVRAFKLASCGVRDDTQIHTHMCYSEFHDILPAIVALDADVITIETSRSRMELLDAFADFAYPNAIGPGVYDIHSPRVPSVDEMLRLIERACAVVDPTRLWVNPDCGLKTRGWAETRAALANMVHAAHVVRERLDAGTKSHAA
jgi:5-methyltetrahydropteroyltriglutamate--homocysteine methyltransferase